MWPQNRALLLKFKRSKHGAWLGQDTWLALLLYLFIVRNFQNQMAKYGNGQGKQMSGPGEADTATVNTTK